MAEMIKPHFERLEGHNQWIMALGFTPDGKQAISVDYGGVIKIWETSRWSCEKTVTTKLSSFNWAIAPDGSRLACGEGTPKVIDWRTGNIFTCKSFSTGASSCVSFSADSKLLLSAGGEVMRLCSVDKLQTLSEVRQGFRRDGNKEVFESISYSAGAGTPSRVCLVGSRGLAIAAGRSVELWDMTTKRYVKTLFNYGEHAFPVRFLLSTVGKEGAVFGNSGSIHTWRNPSSSTSQLRRRRDVNKGHYSAALSSNGKTLLVGSFKGVEIYRKRFLFGFSFRTEFDVGVEDQIHAVALSPDGNWAMAGGESGTLAAWRIRN